jgi:PTH1 family peptidyl-tRNA hydrolase
MLFRLNRRKESAGDVYLIAGLGNPGSKYEKTRHNAGFDALDVLAGRYGIRVNKREHRALTGSGRIAGKRVLLIKPLTYMNLSGEAIREIADYYRVDVSERLIVLSDDVNLAPGRIRIREKGSAGGHNGLKDIIDRTGTEAFTRVRIGVGDKLPGHDMIAHVLGRFSAEDRKAVEEAFEHAADAVELILDGRIQEAMNKFHRK